MARQADRKRETHARVLDAAGRQFRSHGYDGVGVAGVAEAAGITTGALYAHFGSKDGAFEAALLAGLDEVIEAIPAFQARHGEAWVAAFADYYLGRAHREDRECGCAMTALSPDVARGAEEIKALYAGKMQQIAGLVASGLEGGSDKERRARAWSLLASLIGGLILSRAVGRGGPAEEIATAVLDEVGGSTLPGVRRS